MTMQTPEAILRQIETLYIDNYATYLAAVQAKWTATEDIELYDFEVRRVTADPESLGVIKQFPALKIAMGRLVSSRDEMQQYRNWYEMEVQCIYFLRSNDEHELGIILARHIEATMDFFDDNASLGLRQVTISNLAFEPSANVFEGGGNILIKGVRVSFNVKFLQGAM